MSETTLLSSFLVTLGFKLDKKSVDQADKAQRDFAENAEKHADKADTAAKKQAASFKDSFSQIVMGAGAAVAGIAAWVAGVERLAGGYENLYQQSKKSGASAQELKAVGLATAQFGVSAEAATASMADLGAKVKSNFGYAQQLNSILSITGNRLHDVSGQTGVNIEDMRNLGKSFEQIAKSQGLAVAYSYGSSLGMGQDQVRAMMNFGQMSDEQVAKYMQLAKGADEAAKKAHDLQENMRQVRAQFEQTAVQIMSILLPPLKQVANWMKDNPKQAEMVVKGILALGVAASVAVVVGGLATALSALATVAGLLITPVGLVVVAIAALAAGAYYAYQKFDSFRALVDKGLDFLGFTKGVDGISWSYDKLTYNISKAYAKVEMFVEGLRDKVADFLGFTKGVDGYSFSYDKLKDNILGVVNTIRDFLMPMLSKLGSIWSKLMSGDFSGAYAEAKAVVMPIVDKVLNSEPVKATVEVAKRGMANAKAGYHDGRYGTPPPETANPAAVAYKGGKAAGSSVKWSAGALKGFSDGETQSIIKTLMRHESGGKLDIVNKWGYSGKYQFGASALAEAGFIDKEKLAKASKGVKNGSDAAAHKTFLADKSNWIRGDWDTYLHSHEMQDESMKTLFDKNVDMVRNKAAYTKAQLAGFGLASHLKGAGSALKWYGRGVDSKDGLGTRASLYAKEGEDAVLRANANLAAMSNTRIGAIPTGNSTQNINQTNTFNINGITDPHAVRDSVEMGMDVAGRRQARMFSPGYM